ncbi:hypothetical protein DSO57_1008331, partial [Entomophthora muscae]
MTPSERHNKLPNEGKEAFIIGLMSLMSTLVANQNSTPEESKDQKATPNNISQN